MITMNKIFNLFINLLLAVLLVITFFHPSYIIEYKRLLWILLTVLMLQIGIYLSFKKKFVQLNFIKIGKEFQKNKNLSQSLKYLSLTLGAKIGIGCLAGVALAIYIGGPGTVFWMVLSSLIVAVNTYAESCLGVKYQTKENDHLTGGPSYYIRNGLKNPKLAYLYALLIIVAYVLGFLPIQANTIIKSLETVTAIPKTSIVILLLIVNIILLIRKSDSIINFISKLVPLMTISYLFLGIYIIGKNITLIPTIISKILVEAFSLKSSLTSVIIIGIQRGIFASEAGIGTSALATASVADKPSSQGLFQVLGVHITVLVICLITAITILTCDYNTLIINNLNGIELTLYAFNYHLGSIGGWTLCLFTIMFAISTITSGYYYGEKSLLYIIPKGNFLILPFKILTIALMTLSCFIETAIIWDIIDILVAFLALINLYALVKLSDQVD